METTYCSNCGSKISKESKFCRNCGEKINLAKPVAKTTTTPPVKKEKGGLLRTLGKVALWFFGILIVVTTIFYFMGDAPDTLPEEDQKITEESISKVSEDEMKLPLMEVRQANVKLSGTSTFQVVPKNEPQEFSFGENIKVTLPTNFTSTEKSLSISNAEIDETVMVEGSTPLMTVDITLGNKEQPPKPLVLSYSYKPENLHPNFTPEEQLAAFRWDEKWGRWIDLPIQINKDENEINILTDHLSVISAVLIGVGIYATYVGYGEYKDSKILTDIYITPKENFRILYSKKKISKDVYFKDKKWRTMNPSSTIKYSNKHPLFIQDCGQFLEQALNRYKATYGFQDPTILLKVGNFGTFIKKITVMMDSYKTESNDPYYEKISERLYIPTSKCNGVKPAKLTLAHELFHRMQAEYYGKTGMLRGTCNEYSTGGNCWWIEATAEYAAYQMAYDSPISGIDWGIGNDYLHYPIDKTGKIKTSKRDYEYITSIWIKFLVDSGYSLKKMIAYDASDFYKNPIPSLENYLSKKHNVKLGDVYRDFANWMMFSPESYLKKYSLASFDSGNKKNDFIAINRSKLKLGNGKETSYAFQMPDHYTSKLWAIKLIKDPLDKNNNKKPIIIKIKSKTFGIAVDIFVLAQGERTLNPPKPTKSIYTEDKPVMVLAKPTDLIYITASQGSESGGNTEVIVSDANVILEIDPPELPNVKAREANYFTITAKNIPEEIEKVNFEWDYNDGSEKGIHDFVYVSNGEARQEISHDYDESDKEEIFPLRATLKDANINNMVLAEAEALVTLPFEKPSVFIPESILIGPPGATFDLEALASPENTYKFVWTVEGMAEEFTQTGKKSGIAPIINNEGEYAVTVKLFDMNDVYLSMASASISVVPDDLDTEGVDGIVGIDDDKESNTGHWVLYETKAINGCDFYKSKCWPLAGCSGSAGNYSISVGSSSGTCGKPVPGHSGSGSYTLPPSKLIPGQTLTFEATASGHGYTSVWAAYYDDIKKMSFDEKGGNTGESYSWSNDIVRCKEDSSPAQGEYKIPLNPEEDGALLIVGGGSIGTGDTSRRYFFLYKWQE